MSKTERPLSPHISIYRWPITMLLSILHRITGMALAFDELAGQTLAHCLVLRVLPAPGQWGPSPGLGYRPWTGKKPGKCLRLVCPDVCACGDRYLLGAPVSGSATRHFIAQRVSAILLVILTLWFALSIHGLDSVRHDVVVDFFATPLHSAMLALLTITMAFHSYLGVQMIIED